MSGELITAAQILAGSQAGAWVADKLFGPTFEEAGSYVKVYATSRVKNIIETISSRKDQRNITSLHPSLAVKFLQEASFSEDDPDITDMWANLLIRKEDSKPSNISNFMNALGNMSGDDARVLEYICGGRLVDNAVEPLGLEVRITQDLSARRSQYFTIEELMKGFKREGVKIHYRDDIWPILVFEATDRVKLHYLIPEDVQIDQFCRSISILERQNLIRVLDLVASDYNFKVCILTTFGVEFYRACGVYPETK